MNQRVVKAYAHKMSSVRRAEDKNAKPVTVEEAEAEIARIMQAVAKAVAPVFRFGYHTVQDMEQQGIIEALEAIEKEKYDVQRPLENFLYAHIRNRLSNYKRKNYQRLEAPCRCCNPYDPPAYPCKKWLDWSKRNSVRQNIMRPLDMSNISDESESNMRADDGTVEDVLCNELRSLLDRELPVELRRDYLQMLDGKAIPKARKEKVRQAVLEITKSKGYFDGYATERPQEGPTFGG